MRALSACDRYATCGTAVLAERRARASGCSTHLVAAVGQVSGRVLASGLRRTGHYVVRILRADGRTSGRREALSSGATRSATGGAVATDRSGTAAAGA